MSIEDIARQARAWQAQLRDQVLRSTDAGRIAPREAGWQGWALAERQGPAGAATWYGPDSAETRQDPAELTAGAEALIARAGPQSGASQRQILTQASTRARPPQASAAPQPEPHAPEASL